MGKNPFSFRRTSARRRLKKTSAAEHTIGDAASSPPTPPQPQPHPQPPTNNNNDNSLIAAAAAAAGGGKGKKKTGGARLWMRFDRTGQSELVECDKNTIIRRASIPPRDLRILGPLFSHSSNILAREKAMVVNLEFIKAIVTAEEVLLLDPLRQEVLPFVDQLRQQLPNKSPFQIPGAGPFDEQENEMNDLTSRHWLPVPEAVEGLQCELPFEFQVLEIALEVVCTYLDSSVADLEREAYPVLDELARNVSTKNLELVRSLKSNLTRLLARVQKVRDEIEHLLDDNEDMAHLYLTRKWIQNQQSEALLGASGSNSINTITPQLPRISSKRSGSLVSNHLDDNDVEDLEMLLEAYFMQLDGTRNKILSWKEQNTGRCIYRFWRVNKRGGQSVDSSGIWSFCSRRELSLSNLRTCLNGQGEVREYIDDTEDYVNIQLDNQRNELIQLQLTLTIASFAIAVETLLAGMFGMNIPCTLYNKEGIFELFVGGITAGSILLFLLVLGYARWKKLLGS
ncbi:Magnesium transporter [Trema orientale]|uniref:Magnesium transporter n=1 Tax=Trema orientale TaxID=63057 RepID=A0A2P5CAV3_TREOI|nr:Magnesium transporter [Trema orientale]